MSDTFLSRKIGMSKPALSTLLGFLTNQSPHPCGMYLHQMQLLSRAELEVRHDYIQWFFPLLTPSACHPYAPVLTYSELEVLMDRSSVKLNILANADVMIRFFFAGRFPLIEPSHNDLRMSRMIRCLANFGFKDEAAEVLNMLETIYKHRIGSMVFWRESLVEGSLEHDTLTIWLSRLA
jgi:hypothetical protein